MAKNSFVLHLDSLSILDEMPDEMAGQFLKILYKFKNTGELPKMDFAMKIAVTPFVNQFRRDDEKYGNTVEKRSLAGSKGGKQKVANASKSKQKVANVAESDSDSVSDSESVKENESVNDSNATLVFERFRKLYPGDKRGLETELKTLKKHKDWKVELLKLETSITAEIAERQEKKKAGGFVAEWPMLSTYLNQRRWETVREQPKTYLPPEQRQVTPDLPNHKRGVEYRRSGIANRTFKGNYNEFLDAKGCTPDETFTIVREYVIG